MDIDPKKALAALAELEAERRRRQQARGEAEVIVIGALPDDIPIIDSTLSEEERLSIPIGIVITGIPPKGEPRRPMSEPKPYAESRAPVLEEEKPVSSPAIPSPAQYVFATLRAPSEKYEGVMAEGFYRVAGNELILEDMRHEVIAIRALAAGEDPARLAKMLLHENADEDITFPINYPHLKLA